jgi:hypothetical protein
MTANTPKQKQHIYKRKYNLNPSHIRLCRKFIESRTRDERIAACWRLCVWLHKRQGTHSAQISNLCWDLTVMQRSVSRDLPRLDDLEIVRIVIDAAHMVRGAA